MYSEILTPQDFEACAAAMSLPDLWATLEKTSYGQWLSPTPSSDAFDIERQLHQATALRFRRALRTLRGKPLLAATILLSRWDLDVLLMALRRWHGRSDNATACGFYPTFTHILPLTRILEADGLVEVAATLRHTPYADPILSQARAYHEKRSIALVEVALERDYYQRLLSAIAALGGRDAQESEVLVSAEIDLLNLTSLARRLHYDQAAPNTIVESLVPGPSRVYRALGRSGASLDTAMGALSGRLIGAAGELTRSSVSPEAIALLERAGHELLTGLARQALAGFPFRFTCVLALYTFKRLELRNLRAVFAAKAAGLNAEETVARLHGLN
jgi:vacuolar-type H+-ATPase subunit C/Vma6